MKMGPWKKNGAQLLSAVGECLSQEDQIFFTKLFGVEKTGIYVYVWNNTRIKYFFNCQWLCMHKYFMQAFYLTFFLLFTYVPFHAKHSSITQSYLLPLLRTGTYLKAINHPVCIFFIFSCAGRRGWRKRRTRRYGNGGAQGALFQIGQHAK